MRFYHAFYLYRGSEAMSFFAPDAYGRLYIAEITTSPGRLSPEPTIIAIRGLYPRPR